MLIVNALQWPPGRLYRPFIKTCHDFCCDLGFFSAVLPQVQMVSSMRIGRNVNYRILDIDWCTSDKVVLASDDGCIRVLEMAMKSASYRMDEQDLTGETGTQKVEARCDLTRDFFSKGFSARLKHFCGGALMLTGVASCFILFDVRPAPLDPVWCPYLLVPRAALTLKAFLLLQPWSGTFTMDITQV